MPGDVPVATVGVGSGGARNAGLLAVQILALADPALQEKLVAFKQRLVDKVAGQGCRTCRPALTNVMKTDRDPAAGSAASTATCA